MNRLQRFRATVRALDPTSHPHTAIKAGFYVEPPTSLVESLVGRLALSPASTNLLLGHVGSGKTTTLLQAVASLKDEVKAEGDHVQYIDVTERHQIDLELDGVLVALVGKSLVQRPPQVLTANWNAAKSAVRRHADTYVEWVEYAAEGPEPDEYDGDPHDEREVYAVRNEGALKPPKAKPLRMAELIRPLTVLRQEQNAIFFFDSLDRLTTPSEFTKAVSDDLRVLKDAGVGVVIAGPVRYALEPYRAVYDLFDKVHTMPTPNPMTPDGERFLIDVLLHRLPAGIENTIFDHESLSLIAKASGGVLRNLVGLARSAAEEAYAAGKPSVTARNVEVAAGALGDTLAFGLDDEQLAIVTGLINTGNFVIHGERELALLDSARVLFRGPGTYEVHPALGARLFGA